MCLDLKLEFLIISLLLHLSSVVRVFNQILQLVNLCWGSNEKKYCLWLRVNNLFRCLCLNCSLGYDVRMFCCFFLACLIGLINYPLSDVAKNCCCCIFGSQYQCANNTFVHHIHPSTTTTVVIHLHQLLHKHLDLFNQNYYNSYHVYLKTNRSNYSHCSGYSDCSDCSDYSDYSDCSIRHSNKNSQLHLCCYYQFENVQLTNSKCTYFPIGHIQQLNL